MRIVIYTLLLVCSSKYLTCKSTGNYFSNRELALQNVKSIIVSEKECCIPEYVLKTADGVLFYRLKIDLSSGNQRAIKYLLQSYQNENNITHAEFTECAEKIRVILHDSGLDVIASFSFNDKFNDVAILCLEKKKIGKIRVNGSKSQETDNILSYLSQHEGEEIDRNALTSSLDVMNNNYWKKGEIEFLESDDVAATDVTINMEEKSIPTALFGFDNIASVQNHFDRVYLGVNFFNVLGSCHNVSFLAARSSDFSSYQMFDVDYKYSYGKKSAFSFLLHLEDLHGKATTSGSEIKTEGRYQFFLNNKARSQDKIAFGSFYNTTNTNAFNGGKEKFDQNISSIGMLTSFESFREFKNFDIKSNITTYIQPKSYLKSTSKERYKAYGNIDTNIYSLLQTETLLHYHVEEGMLGNLHICGQYAMTNIPSFAKFSLCKQNGMGGYKRESLLFDSGLIIHTALYYRGFSPVKYLIKKNRDYINIGGFFDLGLGKNKNETSKLYTACGPKIECSIFKFVQAAVSVEFPLLNSRNNSHIPDINFKISSSY